jgi:hypothetical protein
MTPTSSGYVSVIGINYLHPLSSLLESLESLNPKGPNEVQASPLENGYSVAIIVLAVLLLESAINRTQYVRGEKPPKKPVNFVRATYPTSAFGDKLEELFVVRDVIVHNHLWEAQITWDEQMTMGLVSANREEGYGDKKFDKVLNPAERKTRQLGLNLFPTRICRTDAVLVLKNVVEFLLFLENGDRRYIYISPQPVKFKGNMVNFTDLVASL